MNELPHQSALRKGRISIPDMWYSVTSCIQGRRYLLIPDPLHPLEDTKPAQIIIECIRWLHEQKKWICKGYTVMPNHIHIVFVLGDNQSLSGVMASFGKYTARRINELTNDKGSVWQHGFYDHCLRNDESYVRHLRYIYENPVRKGWVQKPEDWPFSAIEPNW
ncbi:MAG: transposase [Nitrospinae bacterium]|nr:transposase [Nitrospinota bacterium]